MINFVPEALYDVLQYKVAVTQLKKNSIGEIFQNGGTHRVLTLSQTRNILLFHSETVCRRQF